MSDDRFQDDWGGRATHYRPQPDLGPPTAEEIAAFADKLKREIEAERAKRRPSYLGPVSLDLGEPEPEEEP